MSRCQRCGAMLPDGYNLCSTCYYAMMGQAPAPVLSIPRPRHNRWLRVLTYAVLLPLTMTAGALALTKPFWGPKLLGMSGGHASPDLNISGSISDPAFQQSSAQGSPTLQNPGEATVSSLALAAHDAMPSLIAPEIVSSPGTLGVNPAPPTLVDPSSQGTMPADVLEWLKHLQRIEIARGNLARQQVSEAAMLLTSMQSGALSDAGSDSTTDHSAERKSSALDTNSSDQAAWDSLLRDFQSKPPPAECTQLAGQMSIVLKETGVMISEISASIRSAAQDPQNALQQLMGMQGKSGSRIDLPAKDADGSLGAICAKYSTTKWFAIGSDFGSGVSQGLLGG